IHDRQEGHGDHRVHAEGTRAVLQQYAQRWPAAEVHRHDALEKGRKGSEAVGWREWWFDRRLSGKPGGWREIVRNRQQLDFGGDQISPAKRSIAARQPYTTSVLRRPARVCGFSTRPFPLSDSHPESARANLGGIEPHLTSEFAQIRARRWWPAQTAWRCCAALRHLRFHRDRRGSLAGACAWKERCRPRFRSPVPAARSPPLRARER